MARARCLVQAATFGDAFWEAQCQVITASFAALSISDNDVATLNRIAKVESRCTPAALAFLRQLKRHPRFGVLLERLERIGNTISRADIEDAYAEVTKGLPQTGKKG